ncbi:uncharacterized protein LOC124832709 isoform X2 [Vigna umbellata]|uniref:uncharacterized protein LOC124832709 isoform X2 n=1 Tax=Vigna umbellata TaxID=87088 RepID=UPI001F5FA336|nr:uncharacterized protein LOC124832709 isoform X2 [Vigna umbellata]
MAGDAALPPWAKGSPREFISKHWEACEPDFLRKFASLDRPYFWIQAKSEERYIEILGRIFMQNTCKFTWSIVKGSLLLRLKACRRGRFATVEGSPSLKARRCQRLCRTLLSSNCRLYHHRRRF